MLLILSKCHNFDKLQKEEQFNYLLNSDDPIVRVCLVCIQLRVRSSHPTKHSFIEIWS